MNADEFSLSPLTKLIIYVITVALGGCGWLVFNYILYTPVQPIENYSDAVAIQIGTTPLREEVIADMRQGVVYTDEELSKSAFNIYIVQEEGAEQGQLNLVRYEPSAPYDRGYVAPSQL